MESGNHSPSIPIDKVIARELEIIGSHGMQAYRYPEMLEMVRTGRLQPNRLIGKTVSLEQGARELAEMNAFQGVGMTIIKN